MYISLSYVTLYVNVWGWIIDNFLKSYPTSQIFFEFLLCVCLALCKGYRTHKDILLRKLASGWRGKQNLENDTRQFLLNCGGNNRLVHQSIIFKEESHRFSSLLEVLYKKICLRSQTSLHWDLVQLWALLKIINCSVSLGLIKLE